MIHLAELEDGQIELNCNCQEQYKICTVRVPFPTYKSVSIYKGLCGLKRLIWDQVLVKNSALDINIED